MKKKRIVFLLVVMLLVSVVAVVCGCDYSARVKPDEYELTIELAKDGKSAKCFVAIDMEYYGENSDKLQLIMNSAPFNDKLMCEVGDLKQAYPNGESYGKVTVNTATVNGINAVSELNGNVLSLGNSKNVKNGKRYEVEVAFELVFPNTSLRYGYNNYSINLANFYPQNARIDEYNVIGDPFCSYLGNYKATIIYPEYYKMLASGDLIDTQQSDGMVKSIYSADNCRDYALVFSNNCKIISEQVDELTINYLYTRDKTPEKTLATAVNSIAVFSKLFGKYGRKTFNVCETLFLHGGMEFSGLILVSNKLPDDERERVVIHEAAHQWWYDAIASDQINHSWQDEGLTEFSVYLYYIEVGRADKANELLWYAKSNVNAYRNMILKSGLASDEQMDRSLGEFASGLEYTYSTYLKGLLMFNYLCESMGKDTFVKVIGNYYKENKHKQHVSVEDFVKEIDKGQNGIKLVVKAWLDGNIIIM